MIADEIRIDAPIASTWHAIDDPTQHADWHPFVHEIIGTHKLGDRRPERRSLPRRQAASQSLEIARSPDLSPLLDRGLF